MSCSSGANRLGRNSRNEAWRTAERRKRPCVRPATFEMGSCSSRGVWLTAKRRKRTSYDRNGGPVDQEECGVPQNGRNGPPTVETGVLLIGRGVAYRQTDETDLLRSKRGSCSSGGVWRTAKQSKRTSYGRNGGPADREGCGVLQNGGNGLEIGRAHV